MARVNHIGFESGDFSECHASSGTVSVQTSTVKTGTYALRSNPTGGSNGYATLGTVLADGTSSGAGTGVATAYLKFEFRYATKATSADEPIVHAKTIANNDKWELRLDLNGKLKFYDSAMVQSGSTGSTTLNSGTWYTIEVKAGTGASAAWEVKIDGTSEISGTANLTTSNNGSFRIGVSTKRNANAVDYFFDDVVLDDASFPGESEIKILLPDGNGSTAQWTSGTAPSNYTSVDEIPPGSDGTLDTSYIAKSSAASQTHLVTLQSSATGGISGTIKSVKAFVYPRESAGGTTAATGVRIRSSSSNSDSNTRNGSTTYTTQVRIIETDPATSSAWTTSGIDAMEVGVFDTSSETAVRCSSILAFVEYTPSSDVTGTAASTAKKATQAASGNQNFTGTAASTTKKAVQALVGETGIFGTGTSTTKKAVQAAVGNFTFQGTGASTAKRATEALAGNFTFEGTAASTAKRATQAAAGNQTFSGAAASTAKKATQAAAGNSVISGTATSTTKKAVQAATGSYSFEATATSTAKRVTQAASGNQNFIATGASTTKKAVQAATGESGFTGSAASVAKKVTQSASGNFTFEGVGASTAKRTTQAATGSFSFVGTGASVAKKVTQAASGDVGFTGSAASVAKKATQSALGNQEILGVGASVMKRTTQEASGSIASSTPTETGPEFWPDDIVRKVVESRRRKKKPEEEEVIEEVREIIDEIAEEPEKVESYSIPLTEKLLEFVTIEKKLSRINSRIEALAKESELRAKLLAQEEAMREKQARLAQVIKDMEEEEEFILMLLLN
jgi:hypothetical protein